MQLTIMGGTRNLKLGGRAQAGNNFFVCVGQISTLFSCFAHPNDVVGSRGRALGRRIRGYSPLPFPP